ncbi:MAG: DegT/DnrJ/EryC1/StrS family aminotransferase [Dehalococcoidales bacterium]|nr:DegT/DnrJ/EryC1/StrS family aminotransferase [Dehalococcoidales bacterium]
MPYKVPFVDYPCQYRNLKQELDAAFTGIMSGGNFILREHVRRFEDNVASFLGVKHAVGLNSGTDALLLSLLALGIGRGDEVITVAHTFLATVGAIVNCGATPVLIDVSAADHNMDISQLEAAITKRTKAIIPVHLNGRICDMDPLMAIARKHRLLVVEDAAQALGASYNGKKAGSFGDTSCYSFYPAKILGTAGDGGMLTTNDDTTAEKVRALRDNGRVMGQDEVVGYGFNSRLDNLHAALLDVKFKHVPRWIERRRQIAARYQKGLAGISQLRLPPPPENGKYYDAYQNYVIRSSERDRLVKYLKDSGVEILVSWPIPMNRQKALNLSHFRLPETERISAEVLSLPMYPELADDKVDYVIDVLHNFHRK